MYSMAIRDFAYKTVDGVKVQFLPITSPECVLDKSGTSLDTKLSKVLYTGTVPSGTETETPLDATTLGGKTKEYFEELANRGFSLYTSMSQFSEINIEETDLDILVGELNDNSQLNCFVSLAAIAIAWNLPVNEGYGYLEVFKESSAKAIIKITNAANADTYIITKINNVWGEWITCNNIYLEEIADATTEENTSTTGNDYAEYYEVSNTEEILEPGDVVSVSDFGTVNKSSSYMDKNVVGVYSDSYGLVIGTKKDSIPVGLAGRVYVKVVGDVNRGDLLVASAIPGVAEAISSDAYVPGTVIGKAIETRIMPNDAVHKIRMQIMNI